MYAQLASIYHIENNDDDDGRDEIWGIAGIVTATTLLTLVFLALCFAGAQSASLRGHPNPTRFMSGSLTLPALPPRRQIDI